MTAYESFRPPAGGIPIEVEVRKESELREALAAGADAVLLDTTFLTQAEQVDRIVALANAVTQRADDTSAG